MVGKMKKISSLFVFLYFITLLFVVACSETGELPVAPVPEISSIIIPSTESIWPVAIKNADLAGDWLSF